MSSNWDPPSTTDPELATFDRESTYQGEGYDILQEDTLIPGITSTVAMASGAEDSEVDITAGQKMISAMSGSLLTSLLGKSYRK